MSDTCRTCKYWVWTSPLAYDAQGDNSDVYGICRRYPPVVATSAIYPEHPRCHHNGWCGEWKDPNALL